MPIYTDLCLADEYREPPHFWVWVLILILAGFVVCHVCHG